MLYISYSHIDKSRQECQLQYYYTYYLKKKQNMANIYAIQGTAIHEALQFGFTEEGYLKPLPVILSKYLMAYEKAFVSSFDGNRKNLIVMNKDCRNKPWQFVYEKFRDEGVEILTKYYHQHKDEKQNILGLEKKIDLWISKLEDEDKVKIIGYIDKIIKDDENTIRIVDYKTSSSSSNVDNPKDNLQLQIYDYAARRMYPNFKNYIVEIDFVKINKNLTYEYDEKQQLETLENIKSYIEEIKYKRELYDFGIVPTPKKGSGCVFCGYKDICPLFS